MKRRTITLVIGIVVICLLGGAYFGLRTYNARQEEAEEEAEAGETIEEIDPAGIQEVSFEIDGEEVTFAQQDSGEWNKTDDETFPVDTEVLLSSLDTLSDLRSVRTLTDPEDLSEYGLDEPQQVITLTEEDGGGTVLTIGDRNEVTGDDYLMRNGDASVIYTVGEELLDVFSYGLYDYARSEELPYLSASEITGIRADPEDGEGYQLTLENGVWLVDGKEADTDLADDLAEAAAGLLYESYLDHDCTDLSVYGLDQPWATLTITWQEPAESEEESDSFLSADAEAETETETGYLEYSETWKIGEMDEYLNDYVQLEGSTEVHTLDGDLISELFGYTAGELTAGSDEESEEEMETENK